MKPLIESLLDAGVASKSNKTAKDAQEMYNTIKEGLLKYFPGLDGKAKRVPHTDFESWVIQLNDTNLGPMSTQKPKGVTTLLQACGEINRAMMPFIKSLQKYEIYASISDTKFGREIRYTKNGDVKFIIRPDALVTGNTRTKVTIYRYYIDFFDEFTDMFTK